MRIFLLCPDSQQPIGGIKIIYQQVDILNKLGYQAFVLHTIKGFRCQWFENKTAIAYFNDTTLDAEDVLWVPENAFEGLFKKLGAGERWFRKATKRYKYKHTIIDLWNLPCRMWVFNQGAYITFDVFPADTSLQTIRNAYSKTELVICASDNAQQYLRLLFPDLPVKRLHFALNNEGIFKFISLSNKKKRIAYMPSKNPAHIKLIKPLLEAIPAIKSGEWSLVPLANISQIEMAKQLSEAAMFLSFSFPEGFSMPPAEAMLSGCMVVGYHGEGGREYFTEEFGWPIATGAFIKYANQVAVLIADWEGNNLAPHQLKCENAANYIANIYTESRNLMDLDGLIKSFL